MAAVEERDVQHGDSNAIKARLEQERMQFQNTRAEAGTKETHSVAPVIAGEHVHHHVHEVSPFAHISKKIKTRTHSHML